LPLQHIIYIGAKPFFLQGILRCLRLLG
jgi:hypothetical protein